MPASIVRISDKAEDERGGLMEIINGEPGLQMNILYTKAGFVRGNHYHKRTKEFFFVLEGEIKFVTVDEDTKERHETVCPPGDRIEIPPTVRHALKSITDSTIIEYKNEAYNDENPDTFPFEVIPI